jgi:putative selenate reductase
MDALSFLRRFRMDPAGLALGRFVAVIGAGDTAMDAARAAKRCTGVQGVTVVYRRSESEMPASVEEYQEAREEGIGFRFLLSPEKLGPGGGLLCRVMELGAPDEGGRRRPVSTQRTESIDADTVIAATGAEADTRALEALGLVGADLETDPGTQETGVPGVFLIGDAASGAQTIVKAIASARRAAEEIVKREGGSRYRQTPEAREDITTLRSLRDRIRPAPPRGVADRAALEQESLRCLGCGALCLKCVEVCPNRANAAIRVMDGFQDELQIIHLDGPCNECGNCATFCPWDGRPYRDKLTLYDQREDFRAGENPGFFIEGGFGALRLQGRVWEFALDGSTDIPPTVGDERTRAVIGAILRGHSYLLESAGARKGGLR